MQIHRWIAVAVVVALGGGMVPATALAGDDRTPVVRRPVLSQGAIDRAVKDTLAVRTAAPPSAADTARTPARTPRKAQGGGKSMMIMTIVGTVVGIGTTYYMLKELRKNQDSSGQ